MNTESYYPLSISMLEIYRGVIVTQLSNKFGVKPAPPWHCPIATTHGLERINFTNYSLHDTFHLGITPGLDALESFSGGRPNAVLLNSVFWDLSHPDPQQHRLQSPDSWLMSWKSNVTTLINIVKSRYYGSQWHLRELTSGGCISSVHPASSMWFGWRTGTRFNIVPPQNNWHTQHAFNLMLQMNEYMRNASRQLGVDIVDAFQPHMRLRDSLHPFYPISLKIVDTALQQAMNFLNLSDC
jgi:hypothetical protein